MKIIAKLVAAGVDPDLVGEVAQAIADAQAGGERSRTLRQERNARYYDNRLNKTLSDASKTIKTQSDDQDAASPAREIDLKTLDSKNISYQKAPLKGGQKGKVLGTSLSEDAQPTDKDCAVAERVGMDDHIFRNEWVRFRGHHVARGSRMKNWHQAWVTWAHGWRPHPRAGPAASTHRTNPYYDGVTGRKPYEHLQHGHGAGGSEQPPDQAFGNRANGHPTLEAVRSPGWREDVFDIPELGAFGGGARKFG